MNLYEETMLTVHVHGPGEDLPFDCDECHRRFTGRDLADLSLPFLNRGEQKAFLVCPECDYRMPVTFAADSIQ
jgi:hypothetical protein